MGANTETLEVDATIPTPAGGPHPANSNSSARTFRLHRPAALPRDVLPGYRNAAQV